MHIFNRSVTYLQSAETRIWVDSNQEFGPDKNLNNFDYSIDE